MRSAIRISGCLLATLVLGSTLPLSAQRGATPIYSFGNDASKLVEPAEKLAIDQNGNVYGAAATGAIVGGNCASSGCGGIFEISPLGVGTWGLTNYYDFSGNADGGYPSSGPVLDSAGNLYGTTFFGGLYGMGTVFQLIPNAGKRWTFRRLHSFNPSAGDLRAPVDLAIDNGILYGATYGGTIFSLEPTTSGWKYQNLASVPAGPAGVLSVNAVLLVNGAIYGTSAFGGSGKCPDSSSGNDLGCGFVFQVKRNNGVWTASIIYSFKGAPNDGALPLSKLINDNDGNFYGTTIYGGGGTCTASILGCGTLFKLFQSNGTWRHEILHNFRGGTTDGEFPSSEPIFNSSHQLIGVAQAGGLNSLGVAYKWSPTPRIWTILENFSGPNGMTPLGGLSFDSQGVLYGTTTGGGIFGAGVIYVLRP